MKDAAYKFKRCEGVCLVYVGVSKREGEDIYHGQGKTGQ
jgi:hypothetical protein